MFDRRERINELANSFCRGKRYEAADRHVEARAVAESVTGNHIPESAYESFLAGWDAASEHNCDAELVEENHALHGIVLQLCARMCLERCPHCNGEGVIVKQGDFDTCGYCDRGYIDKEPT